VERPRRVPVTVYEPPRVRELDAGFLIGLLVGEGSFGGDGRQAQVTLRMHTRHERSFQRLMDIVPGARLYGPYTHGGRSYYQWMSRGRHLAEVVVPLLLAHHELLDDHAWARFTAMCDRYVLTFPPQA
jgi:hypothetical protein